MERRGADPLPSGKPWPWEAVEQIMVKPRGEGRWQHRRLVVTISHDNPRYSWVPVEFEMPYPLHQD